MFKYVNNHIVADIKGKQCLIDTGSPFSLGEGVLNIDGKIHTLSGNSFMGASLDNIADHIGTQLDALIGGDIFSSHEGLFIWTEKMEIHFGMTIGNDSTLPSLEFFSNIPITQITINGKVVKAYIDTGAKQSYLDSTIAEGLPHEGEVSDFYPTLGTYTVPLVSAKYIELNNKKETTLKFAILPESLSGLLSMTGCEAILGMDWLRNKGKLHFQIDYKNKKFTNF